MKALTALAAAALTLGGCSTAPLVLTAADGTQTVVSTAGYGAAIVPLSTFAATGAVAYMVATHEPRSVNVRCYDIGTGALVHDEEVDVLSWQQSEIETESDVLFSSSRIGDGRMAYKIGSTVLYTPANSQCQSEYTDAAPSGFGDDTTRHDLVSLGG